VAASDAERRRLERDIHDGAQQHLVALAVNLGLARDILRDDPQAAEELLAEMATDVRETIQQVRDLAHGIYPPLLRESGLEQALRAAVTRSPVPVTLAADGVVRYSPEIETAVYFCCLEALQNTAKHAPQAAATVTLQQEESTLTFEVADDGPGFDPATTVGGQGFQNMTDRIGAIGGLLSWASALGGGTRVRGEVPLALTADVTADGTP
jgi:signal transduction histidine kinase